MGKGTRAPCFYLMSQSQPTHLILFTLIMIGQPTHPVFSPHGSKPPIDTHTLTHSLTPARLPSSWPCGPWPVFAVCLGLPTLPHPQTLVRALEFLRGDALIMCFYYQL